MRKILNFLTAFTLFAGVMCFGIGGSASVAAAEERYVYVGGEPVGITLNADGLIVTGIGEVATEDGSAAPLAGADLRVGDVVKALDGKETGNLYEFRKRVAESDGGVTLTVERENRTFDIKARPAKEAASGENRLGLFLKEDVGGIGTLTFVTEDGAYAALGHHVCDPETGLCASLQHGKLFDVEIKNDGSQRKKHGDRHLRRMEVGRERRENTRCGARRGAYGQSAGADDAARRYARIL